MQIQVFTRVNCPNKDIRNQINSSWSFLNIIHIHIQKNDTPEMWRVALITSILTLTMFHRSSCKCGEWVRDGSRYQIRWIFGKVPNGFCPPPHFRKVTLRFSRQNCDKSAYVHMEEHLCILWSYFPWDACSTNVQHGNRVKTYPKRPFCITFMLKKPCLKVQILQYKFLDWKSPPPLLELFRKSIRFGGTTRP